MPYDAHPSEFLPYPLVITMILCYHFVIVCRDQFIAFGRNNEFPNKARYREAAEGSRGGIHEPSPNGVRTGFMNAPSTAFGGLPTQSHIQMHWLKFIIGLY